MKKKIPLLLIVVMSVALLGLMLIQVYWIQNALTVKESVFRRDVHEVVTHVRTRLDELELSKNYLRQRKYLVQDHMLIQKLDTLNIDMLEQMSGLKPTNEVETLGKLFNMSKALPEPLYLNSPYIPVEQRLNPSVLDSIITEELNRKGIETVYEYGVYSPLRKKMIFQKTGMYPDMLLSDNSFKAPLYAYFNYPYSDQLLLYFPDERQYVFFQIYGVLIISVVLILIIISAFTTSIITIFKQKKIESMKNDFINNMTHELKTPISTISLACQAFDDKDIILPPEVMNSYIGIISEENSRLQKMVEKVLQTAVIEKGQLKLNKEMIDLHDILADVQRHFELQVKEKGGVMNFDLQATRLNGYADRLHLTNSFFNLTDNAIKYTTRTPEITISTKDAYDGVIIEFKDNGIGISKSNQKKIFEKLYRVHTGNVHNFKGFGLGLSYVKAIIEHHEGNVSLISEPKKGSTFKIYLPFNQ